MIEQAIEAQLQDRTREELAGAWRGLCGMMLVYSAIAVRKKRICRKDDAGRKNAATRWLTGNDGVLRFPECCDALDINAERARQAIQERVPIRLRPPINRSHAGG